MNGAETFCNQKVNIERCQKNQTYVDDFCLDVLFSGFLVTRTRSVGRASFSMIALFFLHSETNGNVHKLRSGAAQFTHFLVRKNIEEKVVNESINSFYVC